MKYDSIYQLLMLVLTKLQDPAVVSELKFPTPSIEIPHTHREGGKWIVELSACNRRESFSILFKSEQGHLIFSLPFFGNRILKDTFEDQTLVSGRGLTGIFNFLEAVERQMELIWMRCLELYFQNGLDSYKTRPSASDPDVVALMQFIGAKE